MPGNVTTGCHIRPTREYGRAVEEVQSHPISKIRRPNISTLLRPDAESIDTTIAHKVHAYLRFPFLSQMNSLHCHCNFIVLISSPSLGLMLALPFSASFVTSTLPLFVTQHPFPLLIVSTPSLTVTLPHSTAITVVSRNSPWSWIIAHSVIVT